MTSKKGNVKLTRKVKSDIAKDEVKKIATEEPGVSSVYDQTSVDPATVAPPLPPAPTYSAAQKIGMFVFPKNNQARPVGCSLRRLLLRRLNLCRGRRSRRRVSGFTLACCWTAL